MALDACPERGRLNLERMGDLGDGGFQGLVSAFAGLSRSGMSIRKQAVRGASCRRVPSNG